METFCHPGQCHSAMWYWIVHFSWHFVWVLCRQLCWCFSTMHRVWHSRRSRTPQQLRTKSFAEHYSHWLVEKFVSWTRFGTVSLCSSCMWLSGSWSCRAQIGLPHPKGLSSHFLTAVVGLIWLSNPLPGLDPRVFRWQVDYCYTWVGHIHGQFNLQPLARWLRIPTILAIDTMATEACMRLLQEASVLCFLSVAWNVTLLCWLLLYPSSYMWLICQVKDIAFSTIKSVEVKV